MKPTPQAIERARHIASQFWLESSDRHRLAEMIANELTADLGDMVLVPKEPSVEMLNAAIDVDAFKLGDISPLGFRESPQRLFARCYRAMIAAAQED